ncbi:hypothetical protein DFS34DRAFT_565305, partial [Phlyctochytrium arcticum]
SPLDEDVFPSDNFLAQFQKNCEVWSMNSEASRRTFIELFLRDVVARNEFHKKMRIFCELPLTSVNENGKKRQKLSGRTDYSIGHSNMNIKDMAPPSETHLIAVEAKQARQDDDIWQGIAEVASL